LLKHYGLVVLGVPRTPSGPDVAAMEQLVETHRPKVFFTNTTFYNPTGTSYALATAFRVLQLAEQHDFMIVEDDIFAEFRDPPGQSLAALDQLHRVIYIQNFSKSISPSLRVGYMVSDRSSPKRSCT
jgi:DNA-binding transcriptional MocR family regulator